MHSLERRLTVGDCYPFAEGFLACASLAMQTGLFNSFYQSSSLGYFGVLVLRVIRHGELSAAKEARNNRSGEIWLYAKIHCVSLWCEITPNDSKVFVGLNR